MKIAVTPVVGYLRGIIVSKENNAVKIEIFDEKDQIITTNTISEELVRSSVGDREITDATNIYIRVDENGVIQSMYNKMAESFLTKDNGYVHISKTSRIIGAQIYIPYADSPFEEWVFRINHDSKLGAKAGKGVVFETVGHSLESFHNFALKTLPGLRVVGTVKEGDSYLTTVQVTCNGVDVQRAGVSICVRGDSGYFPKCKIVTNDQGQAVFKTMPLGLDPSDEIVAEFGFKFFSNITSVKLQ